MAVSRILSMASTAVLVAVSNPIVKSVPAMSLSIVPGIHIEVFRILHKVYVIQ
jgi:hypothetical protein